MPDESTSIPAPPSDTAQGLRTVLDTLLEDMVLGPVDPATVAWDQPIFVLRSAHMKRMRAFLREVVARCATPTLHIMSHARDEEAMRAMVDGDFTFHAYPIPGKYRLEDVPPDTLEHLRAIGFGTLVFLDAGTAGEGLDEAERLLAAIGESRMVSYGAAGTFARPADWRMHRLATGAFYGLIDWYHFRLDPGFQGGPVLPGDALAASSLE